MSAQEHLDDVAERQERARPTASRLIRERIIQAALHWQHFYPYHIDSTGIDPWELACVGSCFRILLKDGIIEKTGAYTRSKKEASGARTVFQYRLRSERKALEILNQNKTQPS